MPRILIILATIVVTGVVRAEDVLPSKRGPNFPSSQHGSAHPAASPNQKSGPLLGTAAPSLQQRDTSQKTQPEHPNYGNARPKNEVEPGNGGYLLDSHGRYLLDDRGRRMLGR